MWRLVSSPIGGIAAIGEDFGKHRHPGVARDGESRDDVVGVPREDHDLRHDAVVRRVGAVFGTPPGRGIDLTPHRGA